MYMLDTNAIIMAVRHPSWPIADKVRKHLGKDLCISAITYGELEYGIRKSAYPERNRRAVTSILSGIRIIDFDSFSAQHFGDIFAVLEKENRRIGDRDMLIAANARANNCILVTDNTSEFSRVKDLMIENWK